MKSGWPKLEHASLGPVIGAGNRPRGGKSAGRNVPVDPFALRWTPLKYGRNRSLYKVCLADKAQRSFRHRFLLAELLACWEDDQGARWRAGLSLRRRLFQGSSRRAPGVDVVLSSTPITVVVSGDCRFPSDSSQRVFFVGARWRRSRRKSASAGVVSVLTLVSAPCPLVCLGASHTRTVACQKLTWPCCNQYVVTVLDADRK